MMLSLSSVLVLAWAVSGADEPTRFGLDDTCHIFACVFYYTSSSVRMYDNFLFVQQCSKRRRMYVYMYNKTCVYILLYHTAVQACCLCLIDYSCINEKLKRAPTAAAAGCCSNCEVQQ